MKMSSSSNLSKFEEQKQRMIQEKCQTILNNLLRDDDNKYCVDCDAKGPRWASWNLGVFVCIRCAGIHRKLGVHISRIKSVNLDTWTPEQVVSMERMGNSKARAVYEGNLPENFRRPQTDTSLETFIQDKYEKKRYIAREWKELGPVGKVDWDKEIEEEIRNAKKSKSSSQQSKLKISVPSKTSEGIGNKSNKKSVENPKPVLAPQEDTSKSEKKTSSSQSSGLDDLLGLDLPSNTASPANSSIPSFSNGDSSRNGLDELSSLATGLDSSSQKLTTENILKLYGNSAQTQGGFSNSANSFNTNMSNMFPNNLGTVGNFIPTSSNNPFFQSMPPTAPGMGAGAGGRMTNPILTSNSNQHQTSMGGPGFFNSSPQQYNFSPQQPPQFNHNVSLMSSGLAGLNLGSNSTTPNSNSNPAFASNANQSSAYNFFQ